MDIPAMRASFAKAEAHGDQAPLWFYSHLFLEHPEARDLFPVSMAHQRDRLFAALGEVMARVDDLDELVPILQQLGRDHRKFGTVAAHYPAVGASLLATLEHFDDEWNDALASAAPSTPPSCTCAPRPRCATYPARRSRWSPSDDRGCGASTPRPTHRVPTGRWSCTSGPATAGR
jgi:hemoglobin-like flavoprotein